jgi:asparaginyl-tRNA synthetase
MTKTIKQTLDCTKIGEQITINGWVRTQRNQQDLSFVNVFDGSLTNPIQVVVNSDLENYDLVTTLTSGCSVSFTGILVESPAKGQDLEIKAESFKLIGGVEDAGTYPMPAKRLTPEHLREHAHLRPRSNITGSVARVRQTVSKALHDFFEEEGFLWCSTPLLTASDCEGAGEMFQVTTLNLEDTPKRENGKVDYSKDFFGKQTNLTVSGQLNAETYASALTKVYTFGPTFRAENSHTSRHLAEFWMVEPEVAFADMNDAISLSERMLKYVIKRVLKTRKEDMDFFNSFVDKTCLKRLNDFIDSDFVICDYTKAIEILEESGVPFENKVEWGIDLSSEHERFLAEQYYKSPVAVTNYPKAIKSFYMRDNEDGKTVAAFDILAPQIGEIIGGSQREERFDKLIEKMEENGLNPEDYSWYLDLRRYGTVPHSGFGLGLERLVSYITGVSNIRDVIPFPRAQGKIDF